MFHKFAVNLWCYKLCHDVTRDRRDILLLSCQTADHCIPLSLQASQAATAAVAAGRKDALRRHRCQHHGQAYTLRVQPKELQNTNTVCQHHVLQHNNQYTHLVDVALGWSQRRFGLFGCSTGCSVGNGCCNGCQCCTCS